MAKFDIEGSKILETLATYELMDEFMEAVDADDLDEVESLLRKANVDDDTIDEVIRQIEEGE